MLIINQQKNRLFNVRNALSINILGNFAGEGETTAIVSGDETLGVYLNEKRACEVLRDIGISYARGERIYEMPEE